MSESRLSEEPSQFVFSAEGEFGRITWTPPPELQRELKRAHKGLEELKELPADPDTMRLLEAIFGGSRREQFADTLNRCARLLYLILHLEDAYASADFPNQKAANAFASLFADWLFPALDDIENTLKEFTVFLNATEEGEDTPDFFKG